MIELWEPLASPLDKAALDKLFINAYWETSLTLNIGSLLLHCTLFLISVYIIIIIIVTYISKLAFASGSARVKGCYRVDTSNWHNNIYEQIKIKQTMSVKWSKPQRFVKTAYKSSRSWDYCAQTHRQTVKNSNSHYFVFYCVHKDPL